MDFRELVARLSRTFQGTRVGGQEVAGLRALRDGVLQVRFTDGTVGNIPRLAAGLQAVAQACPQVAASLASAAETLRVRGVISGVASIIQLIVLFFILLCIGAGIVIFLGLRALFRPRRES